MAPALAVFVTFLGVTLGVVWYLEWRPRQAVQDRVSKRLRTLRPKAQASASSLVLERPGTRVSAIAPLARWLEQSPWLLRPLEERLSLAGLQYTPGTVVLGCLTLGATGYLVVSRLSGLAVLGLGGLALGAWLPVWLLGKLAARRMSLFEEQLPETIDLLARALRAGHGFTSGLSMVVEEAPVPIVEEFRLLYDRQNFGVPLPDALREFAHRIPLLDAKFFATAVLIQRESGGNLTEILDNLAGVMRGRFEVKRHIQTKTAHARATALVLSLLPPSLAVLFMVVSPGYLTVMLTDPLGVRMVIGAVVLQTLGTITIRKLANIDF